METPYSSYLWIRLVQGLKALEKELCSVCTSFFRIGESNSCLLKQLSFFILLCKIKFYINKRWFKQNSWYSFLDGLFLIYSPFIVFNSITIKFSRGQDEDYILYILYIIFTLCKQIDSKWRQKLEHPVKS